MKIELLPTGDFAEIYDEGLDYSLLNSDGKAYHAAVLCKDFLTDVFWSEHLSKPASIYDFKWKPGTLDHRAPRFLLAIRHSDGLPTMTGLRSFLRLWDRALGFPLTEVTASGDVFVLDFAREWTEQPVRLSLFTLLVRLGLGYDGSPLPKFLDRIVDRGNKYGEEDASYVGQARELMQTIFNTGTFPEQQWSDYGTIYKVHNNSGIVSLAGRV